jgi:hypothetical protein
MFGAPDVSPALVTVLTSDAGNYRWTAATIGSSNAAGYQLATDTPVMAIGGFNGTDPSPTLEQFQKLVSDKKIHYFIQAKMPGFMHRTSSGSRESADVSTWVTSHFPARSIDGVPVYDLTGPPNLTGDA